MSFQPTKVMPTEQVEYRDAVGFPGYRVGNDGSVWSRWKRVGLGKGNGTKCVLGDDWHRLKPSVKHAGHLMVGLRRGGLTARIQVHQIVALAFFGECPSNQEIRHFPDRTPSNNAASNLRYGTRKENIADRDRDGMTCRGIKNGAAKLDDDRVRAIRMEFATGLFTKTSLGLKYGVHRSLVAQIVAGRIWRHVT